MGMRRREGGGVRGTGVGGGVGMWRIGFKMFFGGGGQVNRGGSYGVGAREGSGSGEKSFVDTNILYINPLGGTLSTPLERPD